MRTFLITLQYAGKAFGGWQKNPTTRSVQGEVEAALEKLFGAAVSAEGCSRTDAGVSALAYLARFAADTKLPTSRIPYKLNRFLPKDVQVTGVKEVDGSYDLQGQIEGKTYAYSLYVSPFLLPLLNRDAVRIEPPFDLSKAKRAANSLIGSHNLTAFCTPSAENGSPVKTIRSVCLESRDERVTVKITGDSFAYNQVRILVGSIVAAGQGKIDTDLSVFFGKTRAENPALTLPAKGLVLEQVHLKENA